MGLSAGTRLGPYEVVSPLGAGGMGEVYRALDTRLERTVAIKVLPSHLSANRDLKQRFEREAKAISSLSHPHICTLHDVGSQDGVDFLVMEYLEGETLADRLRKGALPLEQALKVAIEIAEALEKAHGEGILHRDLKPGNIMLTKAGAKLMDFGLAKPAIAVGLGAVAGPLTPSTPTMSVAALTSPASPLTQKGTIVGTFQYMAPEVLQSGEADARSDIFSFGCVVYEMVTGRRAFEGRSQLSVLTAILEKEPEPISRTKPGTPQAMAHVIESCLSKEPGLRWHTAHDIGLQLQWVAQCGAQGAGSTERAVPERWVWVAFAAITLLALGTGYWLRPQKSMPLLRSSISLPEGVRLDSENASLAISPDGRRLAFTAVETDGKQRLWLRPLDSPNAQPLPGTEGATYPFWSPDSRYIGFFADHALKKADITGGIVQTVCQAEDGRGGTWGSSDMMVFSAGPYSPLYGVAATGGVPAQLTTLSNPRMSHRLPHFLPDGVHLLFYSSQRGGLTQEDDGIYGLDVQTKQVSLVTREKSGASYIPGYILFVRNRNLMAQRFDASRLRTMGDAVPIVENVLFNSYRFNGEFAVSETGLLVYQSGTRIPRAQLTWFDFGGHKLDTLANPASFAGIFLSPDDKQMIAALANSSDELELWIYDLARGVPSRFSFGKGSFDNPVWSPDGKDVAFEDSSGNVLLKAADSRSEARKLFSNVSNGNVGMPSIWARDGKTLLYCTQTTQGFDLWALSLGVMPQAHPFLVTPANECNGSFSPDGKWLAYISDETGQEEMYVVSYPNVGGKRQLTADGANYPNWVDGGRRLVYVNRERKLIVVEVKHSGQELEFGKPQVMFGGIPLPGLPRNDSGIDAPVYVTQDGKRILLPVPVGGESTLTLVSNWKAGLNK